MNSGHLLRRVLAYEDLSEGVFLLRVERGDLKFVAGDCIALFDESRSTSRPYSIC